VSGADPRPLSAHCKARPKAKAPQAEAEEAQMSDERIPYTLTEARYLIRIGQWNDKTMRIVEK
jgi:hypothetical protein